MGGERHGGLVAAFCGDLLVLVRQTGVPQAHLARTLSKSEGAVSALLNGKLMRPPVWSDVAGIVKCCAKKRDIEGAELKGELEVWKGRHTRLVEADARRQRARGAEPVQPYQVDPWSLYQVARCSWADCLVLLAGAGDYPLHAADDLAQEEDPTAFRAGLRRLCQDAMDAFPARVLEADRRARSAAGHAMVQVVCLAALLDVLADRSEAKSGDEGSWKAVGVPEFVAGFLQSACGPPWQSKDASGGDDAMGRLVDRWSAMAQDMFEHRTVPHAGELTPWFRELLEPLAEHEPELLFHARLWSSVDTTDTTDTADGTALDRLAGALTTTPHPAPLTAPGARMLSRRPSQELDHGLIESAQDHSRVVVPSLGAGYVDPAVRTVVVRPADPVHDDAWWREQTDRRALHLRLAAHFTSPEAVRAPLLVLGHPGVGKSLLTRVLTARLPASDFLPVRVELRSVDADASVVDQIEQSLAVQLDRPQTWAGLVDDAGGRLPVVLLDGLDELMQAGDLGHSDYVEQVKEFQEREAAAERPLAVVVTSRTIVTDRCRIPSGCTAIYLEPFDTARRDRWLATWNAANRRYFVEHGLAELTPAALDPYRELAFQPLLLLLLALYDADGNDLGRVEHSEVSGADLYEQLLLGFVRRQVRKHHWRPRPAEEDDREAEEEMARLGVVALAMFNRGRQSVSGDDVARDAYALLGTDRGWRDDRRFGRFFFIHEAQALRRGRPSRAYEFLHATFSEYLVARSIWRELMETARTGDGTRLYALLSFALLTERAQVLERLNDLVAAADSGLRRKLYNCLRPYLVGCLDGAVPDSSVPYTPRELRPPARLAYYSANLVLLLVLLSREVLVSDLLDTADVPGTWRRLAGLWESQLDPAVWADLPQHLLALRELRGDEDERTRDIRLSWTRGYPPVQEAKRLPDWTLSGHRLAEDESDIVARRAAFTCRADGDLLALGIASGQLGSEDQRPDGILGEVNQYRSDVENFLTLAVGNHGRGDLEELYNACARSLSHLGGASQQALLRSLLIRSLIRDRGRLPVSLVESLLTRVQSTVVAPDALGPRDQAMLEHITQNFGRRREFDDRF